MKKYDLHKNGFKKLHFELKDLAPYFQKNKEKASVPHRHSFFQMLWFKNSGQHYIDYKVIPHGANTLFFINRNQVHYFCEESSNEGYLFHFNDSFLATLDLNMLARFEVSVFNEIADSYVGLSEKDSILIQKIAGIILCEIEEEKENYSDIIFHQFSSLLYHAERLKKQQNQFISDSDFSVVVDFKRLIIENMSRPQSIQNFAEELNISAKKLTSITKLYTSRTPNVLIKDLKILEAKRMLSNRDLSVKEIAYSLGFDQPTYFTKFFKKETQLTPKQFQEQVL